MQCVLTLVRMIPQMKNRNYTELSKLKTLKERFEYLRLDGQVGADTFGSERYLNQEFYRSPKWRSARDKVIIRDEACDLGVPGYDIYDMVVVHHMNPISPEEIEKDSGSLYDPEYLIACTKMTHNAIHYGDENLLPKDLVERKPNDTAPWR